MLPLRDLQSAMAAALLRPNAAPSDTLAAWILDDGIAPTERLAFHRNTALSGAVAALRLTYPVIEQLVGASFFERAALDHVALAPPHSACLADYGADFGAFLHEYEPAASLPYLPDMAHLEWAIEQASLDDPERLAAAADIGGVRLDIAASLHLVPVTSPVDDIWRAVTEHATDRLADIAFDGAPRMLAVWQSADGPGIARLARPSVLFLSALLSRATPTEALARAFDQPDAIATLQREVLSAGFARLTPI